MHTIALSIPGIGRAALQSRDSSRAAVHHHSKHPVSRPCPISRVSLRCLVHNRGRGLHRARGGRKGENTQHASRRVSKSVARYAASDDELVSVRCGRGRCGRGRSSAGGQSRSGLRQRFESFPSTKSAPCKWRDGLCIRQRSTHRFVPTPSCQRLHCENQRAVLRRPVPQWQTNGSEAGGSSRGAAMLDARFIGCLLWQQEQASVGFPLGISINIERLFFLFWGPRWSVLLVS